MSSALSTRPIRDGAGNSFLQRVLDVSGTGSGPFLPVQLIAGPQDGVPIDLAALFAALSDAVDADTDRVAAAIAAIPPPDTAFVPLGHQSVTVTTTAATLAALLTAAAGAITTIPAGTKVVILQPRGDGIRYAHGGATPTTAVDATGIGTALGQDGQYPLRMTDFSSLKLIASSNTILSAEFRG